jgi:hypothetical protein
VSNPQPPYGPPPPEQPGQPPRQGPGQPPPQGAPGWHQQHGQQHGDPYAGQYGQQYGGQYGGPYAGQPPYGPPGYPPPAPKRSRLPLVLGLVILLLLVGGGVTTALLLAGDDDGGDGGRSGGATAASGERLDGEGYSYAMPEGWHDVTDEDAVSGAPALDTVTAWGESFNGAPANVIVERSPGVGSVSPDDVKATWVQNMRSAAGAEVQDYDGTTFDGEDAVGARIERDDPDAGPIVQIAFLAIHDGTAYSVILSASTEKSDEAMETYTDLIDSWTWED